jgi:hypothetical protein
VSNDYWICFARSADSIYKRRWFDAVIAWIQQSQKGSVIAPFDEYLAE